MKHLNYALNPPFSRKTDISFDFLKYIYFFVLLICGVLIPFLGKFTQVFPYGSVPLKTYLPDGDIDLAAFSHTNANDALVSDVHAVLRGEEHNEAARYKVKDVHCIDAEVLPGLILTLELQSLGLRIFSILHSHRVAVFACMYVPKMLISMLVYLHPKVMGFTVSG